jgi:hypothetical protein
MRAINFTRIGCFLLPLLLVVAVGALLFALGIAPRFDKSVEDSPLQPRVIVGKDYYVTVSLLELSERDGAGNPWDSLTESGPDIFVQIYWKGNRIYQSTVKKDTFVAKWSNAELNLRDLALIGEKTSVDDAISAARINIKDGEAIEVRAYDADLLDNTLAGVKTYRLTDLRLGDTLYEYSAPGIKRLVLRVNDMSQAVDPLR